MVEKGRYFVKKIPSSGTWIYVSFAGKDYPIATMRWTDGLNADVMEAIAEDARRIVACLNFCSNISTKELEEGRIISHE